MTTPEHITIDIAGAGATVTGTTKGSPASELFAATRPWKWFRSLGCWGLPRSLRPETVDWRVDQMRERLEGIGVTVEITGTEDRETDQERLARRDARDVELVEIHQAAAARATATGEQLWKEAQDSAALIPLGQPILTDHYSAPRHRRHLDRIHRTEGRAVEALRDGADRAGRAASARARVAAAATRGQAPPFGRHNVQSGDLVQLPWGWFVVVRANPKTVTVPNSVYRDVDVLDPKTPGKWCITVEWRKVRAVTRNGVPVAPDGPDGPGPDPGPDA